MKVMTMNARFEHVFIACIWEMDVWEMKRLLRTEIEKYCWDFDIGVWDDWIWILEVFLTGSEELFSPFLAGTPPDFL